MRDLVAGRPWWHWLYPMQRNEHRMVGMKLVLGLLALPTRWNAVVQMDISVVLAALTALGLWRLYQRAGGTRVLDFAPIVWMVCNLAGYQNMLLSLQTAFYMTALGAVWALACIAVGGPARMTVAVAFSFLASFSTLNGLLIWPAGLVALLGRQASRRSVVAWVVAALACFWMYFVRYDTPPQIGAPWSDVSHPLQLMVFAITALGAPFAAGSLVWGFVIGSVLGNPATGFGAPRHDRGEAGAPVLSAHGPCYLRSSVGWRDGSGTSTGWAGFRTGLTLRAVLVAGAGRHVHARQTLARTSGSENMVAALSRLSQHSRSDHRWVGRWQHSGSSGCRELADAQCPAEVPVANVESPPDLSVHGVEQLKESAAFLESHRLGPFSDPLDLLLQVGSQDGRPLGEILPSQPTEQWLICPVDTLYDVAVALGTYQRANDATLQFALL